MDSKNVSKKSLKFNTAASWHPKFSNIFEHFYTIFEYFHTVFEYFYMVFERFYTVFERFRIFSNVST
jgi:hypothetical protein